MPDTMLRTLLCCLIKSSHHFTTMRQELLCHVTHPEWESDFPQVAQLG